MDKNTMLSRFTVSITAQEGAIGFRSLTLNVPSLARQRCLPSWGPRRTPWLFCNFSTVWCGRLLKLCFL